MPKTSSNCRRRLVSQSESFRLVWALSSSCIEIARRSRVIVTHMALTRGSETLCNFHNSLLRSLCDNERWLRSSVLNSWMFYSSFLSLSLQLCISLSIQVWFQNARAKWRRVMLKQEGKSIDGEKGEGSIDLDTYNPHSPSYMLGQASPTSMEWADAKHCRLATAAEDDDRTRRLTLLHHHSRQLQSSATFFPLLGGFLRVLSECLHRHAGGEPEAWSGSRYEAAWK